MGIDDRFPGYTSVTAGAIKWPGTRMVRATFSDTEGLPFRCRFFNSDGDGVLMVKLPENDDPIEMLVVKGENYKRLDMIYETGSDPLRIELWD